MNHSMQINARIYFEVCGFFVHVPGMNGPNTRGLLGKGLSAPVTTVVFGPFIPGTCICSHNYSIMYQKSNV